MKTLKDCKESLDKIIHWCNDNDDLETAENIELYLQSIKRLVASLLDYIVDTDYDNITEEYDNWDEYLMENFGINYADLRTLTNITLQPIFH